MPGFQCPVRPLAFPGLRCSCQKKLWIGQKFLLFAYVYFSSGCPNSFQRLRQYRDETRSEQPGPPAKDMEIAERKSSGAGSTPPGYGNSAVSGQPGSGPAGPDRKSSPQPTLLQSRMNRSFSKQESATAYEAYKAQQGKFKAPAPGAGQSGRERSTVDSIRGKAGYSSGSDYYSRRAVFYDTYRWSPPGYVYSSYPRFGIWDAMMLWFMLDHIENAQYAAMYYNHRDDPGMQQFRNEIDRLSAENTDLKSKVAKLDESAKSLEQQGVKPDPSYVPQDAASVALAADLVRTQAPESSGFPWAWVIGFGLLAWIVFLLKRRKG